MAPLLPCSDAEIEANASLVAAAVLTHPLSIHLGVDTVAVLAAISERDPPAASQSERTFLRGAVTLLHAAEILAGREAT
jgi:hypothetical protein